MKASIKNWKKFQHFKDRRPPWIKLYRDILDDPDWFCLSGEEAKALVMLWLIASETDGYLPDINKISFRLRVSDEKCKSLLKRLEHWLDIKMISERYQDDTPERADLFLETETETYSELPGVLNTDRFKKTWKLWLDYRDKDKKKKVTPRSEAMAWKKIAEWGHDRAIAAIENSIAQGYQGIFEESSRRGQGELSLITPDNKFGHHSQVSL